MQRRIRKELLDELLAGYAKPEDLTGPDGLLKALTGALVERAQAAELTDQPKCWNLALNQFAIMFEGRLPA